MSPRILMALAAVVGLAGSARAADPKDKDPRDPVKTSIKGGQAFLRFVYGPGGPGPNGLGGPPGFAAIAAGITGGTGIGSPALCGLALLETGLPANDAAVQNIAKTARASVFITRSTYELSLLIMFFDRLGYKEDQPMIQFMTLRLMSGQTSGGAWSYSCDGLKLDAVEERQLQAELGNTRLVTPPGAGRPKKDDGKPREDLDPKNPPAKKDPPPEPKEEPKKEGLHPALEKYLNQIGGAGNGFASGMNADHSNTQFATVGLWVGRRHHVPVGNALKLLDKHYRDCQAADGGWGYTGAGGLASPQMTCAGLMGLAMGFGADNTAKAADDPKVSLGLKYVGQFIATAADQRGAGGGFEQNNLSNNLYFLWSLERVAMVYGLQTIGKIDWYDWGSKLLMRSQQRDGSWQCGSGHVPGRDTATAFALLFLCKANLAEDLTTSLKGKVRDPGTSKLVRGNDLDSLLGKTDPGSKKPEVGTTKPKPVDEMSKLTAALVAAKGAERTKLIEAYRDAKGTDYTDALVEAIERVDGDAKTPIRQALAQRFTRMTSNTLNGFMKDRNKELRAAAAHATASKGADRLGDFAESLIRLIADSEPIVHTSAHAALKELSGQDFGPKAGASEADRSRAFLEWKRWWDNRKS